MQGKMKTVLVVDDDPLVRDVLRSFLSSGDIRVLAVRDGKEALEVIREEPEAVDLFLIDFMIPGMNGRALARTVLSRLPDANILFMSGFPADAAGLEHAFGRRTPFFQKPLDLEELVRTVREQMGLVAA